MILALVLTLQAQAVAPLTRGHAHNDYIHARPLAEALENGYCSVEADVFLLNGTLHVAHDKIQIKPERTLNSLYLAPLAKRLRENMGWVYTPGTQLQILVDIKEDGEAAYKALKTELAAHPEFRQNPQAIRFVVSGDRPVATILADKDPLTALDGRFDDLGKNIPIDRMPLVSDSWRSHFKYLGSGEMPEAERVKLKTLVDQVHKEGRMIRFWASPDRVAIWKVLWESGADFINTDELARFAGFAKEAR